MKFEQVQLSDVCELIAGFAFKSKHFGNYSNKVIKIADITPPVVSMNSLVGIDLQEYNASKLNRFLAHTGDYVLAMTGATIGKIGRIEYGDAYINQRVLLFKNLENKIDKNFLYYILQQSDFKQYILSHVDSESAQPNISAGTIGKYRFKMPCKKAQIQIGEFLRTFDEKIELNQKINGNLEQQAQAVFKAWFMDFLPFNEPLIVSPMGYRIPESLHVAQVSDIPHILETGKRPKGGATYSGIPSIGAENVKRLGVVDLSSAKYIPEEFAATMKRGRVSGYEVMIYKDGGKPGTFTPHFSMFGEGFPYKHFFINEHVFKLDFGNRGYNEFCYLYFQTDYVCSWLSNNGGKAAIPGINQQDINSIWIPRPEHPIVQKFCEWVQPLFTTILKNCYTNMILSELRDAILPKLLSGKINTSTIQV